MKLFHSTKDNVYKMLAEGIAESILNMTNLKVEYYNVESIGSSGVNAMSYYTHLEHSICEKIDSIARFQKDIFIILDYVGDNLLKKGLVNYAYRFYKRVNPKKASVIDNLLPPGTAKDMPDLEDSVGKKLDEIMANYVKSQNPEIEWVPPLHM